MYRDTLIALFEFFHIYRQVDLHFRGTRGAKNVLLLYVHTIDSDNFGLGLHGVGHNRGKITECLGLLRGPCCRVLREHVDVGNF